MSADSSQPAFFKNEPPKPVLTLRVGIVGHRPKDTRYPKGARSFVTKRLRAVFEKIDERLTRLSKEQRKLGEDRKNYYDIGTSPKVRLVTGLAEGADQWAVDATKPEKAETTANAKPETAEAAADPKPSDLEAKSDAKPREAEWSVDAVLPFPLDSYRRDFVESAADKTNVTGIFNRYLEDKTLICVELPEEPAPKDASLSAEEIEKINKRRRDAGYARAGRFLLGQVDLLVAVWDGRLGESPGGTAAMVQGALDAEIPVFWVNSLEDGLVRKIAAIADDGRVDAPVADCLHSTLDAAIDKIVLLPAHQKEGDVDFARRLDDFLEEAPPRTLTWRWLIYDAFKRLCDLKWPRRKLSPSTTLKYEGDWEKLNASAPEAELLRGRLETTLLPRYAWADALAVQYSHLYRSTYFICYLLAATAVLVALSAIWGHDLSGDERKLAFKALLVTVELVTLGSIAFLVFVGYRNRWHDRWLEYRSLAELLLNVRFLSYLGEHGRAHRMGRLESESSAWFLWYLRATIREIGIPDADFDGAYQWKLLNSVKEQVILDQCGWHGLNARALRRMHGGLYWAGISCFIATCVVLVAFLAAWGIFAWNISASQGSSFFEVFGLVVGGPEMENAGPCSCAPKWVRFGGALLNVRDWIVFIAALLPAAGAAFASIRETGDFEKVAKQSTTTAAELADLHRDFEKGENRLKFEHTDELLLRTARVLTEDLSSWQAVYGHKRLELPA